MVIGIMRRKSVKGCLDKLGGAVSDDDIVVVIVHRRISDHTMQPPYLFLKLRLHKPTHLVYIGKVAQPLISGERYRTILPHLSPIDNLGVVEILRSGGVLCCVVRNGVCSRCILKAYGNLDEDSNSEDELALITMTQTETWLAVRILYNMLIWVFNGQTRVSHGDSVECSIIFPPVLIPVFTNHNTSSKMNVMKQPDSTLDSEVRKYPVPGSKWTGISHKAINETPNATFLPGDVEMIKPEIIVCLQPGYVKPIINYHSNAAKLEQGDGFQGYPIFKPVLVVPLKAPDNDVMLKTQFSDVFSCPLNAYS
nr:hypothetical protein Iba_chr07eCG8940 [Ipomoea batatas]